VIQRGRAQCDQGLFRRLPSGKLIGIELAYQALHLDLQRFRRGHFGLPAKRPRYDPYTR
jgi:hypothetical protein